jgi:3-phosphoshikimate 1-carboxyvinyltransferase
MHLHATITVPVAARPLEGSVTPPGSKSLTNRALICAALADGDSTLTGALDSEDTRVMIDALSLLGIPIGRHGSGITLSVHGAGGTIRAAKADLFVANSGTTMRFLTALVTLGRGEYRIDGIARMRERPIGDLISGLSQLGASVVCEGQNDCPPVVVHSSGLPGGAAVVRGDVSSQFLSGLLMAAPYAKSPVVIDVEGELVSQPYVEMTLSVMDAFGVQVHRKSDLRRFEVPIGRAYTSRDYAIEPDASAASYWWAAAAITGGRVTVPGLTRKSLQGDVAFCKCLSQMGCEVEYGDSFITVCGKDLRGIEVDMNSISDTVQTLAVVALFADGPTTIRGVGHIRHKETDRIAAVACELRKLGADVEERRDGLVIRPHKLVAAAIDTYNDHRMAMSFSLAGLRIPGVVIRDPACVQKTYPEFFADLQKLVDG